MTGVKNAFSGNVTITNNLSATNFTCTYLTCANLYSFINTSIIYQCTNYKSSSIVNNPI